ncbi:MAG: hypothetical protein LM575_08135 [Caldimicrobium sp.]|nr:hypothetical protein [Caldimicrobium sp.]
MSKSKRIVSIQADKKYQGLGNLLHVESPILGLATNLEDTKREPFHAMELYALPDLRYGWVSIPKETTVSAFSIDHVQLVSPVTYLVGWRNSDLYIYDLEQRVISYHTTLDTNISSAIFLNNVTIACICPLSQDPLKIIFHKINQGKSYNKKGDCLAFFKGRLFIAEEKILHFTSASITDPGFNGDPFASENGGGYLILNYPQVSKICYLLPWEDMLYIFTDGGLYILTVSLASNSPSTFYIIDAGINYNFSKAKVLQIGDTIAIITNVGMFFLSGMSLERFDWPVADQLNKLDYMKAGSGYFQGQRLILIPYITDNKTLVYSIENAQFFYLPYKVANCVFSPNGSTYDFSQTNLRILFDDTSFYYPFHFTSVLHDYNQTRFKYIKEVWINGKGDFQIDFLYDYYGITTKYNQLGPNLSYYRTSWGRKGYKIGLQITSRIDCEPFAYVNKIYLKIHLLGSVNYFYYAG